MTYLIEFEDEVFDPEGEDFTDEDLAEFAERLVDGVMAGRMHDVERVIETLRQMLASAIRAGARPSVIRRIRRALDRLFGSDKSTLISP